MDPLVREILGVTLRWLHVLLGITWVGYAYFFLFTWTPVALALTPQTRAVVAPMVLARSTAMFRAAAVLTWLTGLMLLGLVYYSGGLMVGADGPGPAVAIAAGVAALLVPFFLYDAVYRSPLGKSQAGAIVCVVGFGALAFGLAQVMTGRAVFIHLGGMLGTTMLANAGMRLVPAQLKMVAMLKGELPFDPQVAALIGQRASHNVVMSVALVAYMLGFHLPSAYGHDLAWALATAIGVVGFVLGKVAIDALIPKPPAPPPAAQPPAAA